MVKKAKKKEILVKIICLLFSFGLWLYINNAQNPIRERVITNIPVEILNSQVLTQDGLAISPNQNITVSLTISGPAAQVYKIDKSQFRVTADLVSYGLKPGENSIPTTVINSPSGVNIKSIYPKVEINLENLEQKTMSVHSEINVKNLAGTYVQDVKINPLSANVQGAESLVNKISKLVVRNQVDNINQSTVLNLPILAVDAQGNVISGLTINPSQAKVAVNLEQGKTVSVNVPTIGELPSNLTLKSITPGIKSVEIVGQGSDSLTSLNTTPIDLSKITENTTIPVTVNVPQGMVNISGKNTINVEVAVVSNTATKSLSVPIELIGQKDGFTYKAAQTTAELVLSGEEAAMNAVDLNGAICQADVSTLTQTGDVTLKLVGGNFANVTVAINPAVISVEMIQDTTTKPDTTTPPIEDPNKPVVPPVVPPNTTSNSRNKTTVSTTPVPTKKS